MKTAARWVLPAFVLNAFLSVAPLPTASAQNPNWPNTSITSVEELQDPANWPDDPSFGYDIRGDGTSCIGDGLRCWNNETGGQWNQWSWVPPEATEEEGFREEEAALGSGSWADFAWTLTPGEQSTVIAVLDSGINWDERDLINQYYLNREELEARGLDADCLPERAGGGRGVDRDGDGFLTMRDWFFEIDAEDAAALRTRIDEKGNENGVADPGDLITFCSDDVDDDGNGYVDDISGWDFHNDDNDPADDTRFGHGTGEARWSAAEANNGIGRAGFCPGCRILMVRAGDSFVVDVQDYSESVIFSVDSGATVIQEALGSINHSTFMRRATDYAYDNGVIIIASAADENSFHHNFPGTTNHTLYVHAIRPAAPRAQNARSFLAFNNCTNYGAQLAASAPGTGCSSEATGVTAGIAGLVVSAATSDDRPGGPIDPPLSAEEIRQVLLMETDDIWVPESDPEHPEFDREWYPSKEGWDQRFGFGRINAYRSVVAVREGRIPPEVDLYSPDWFRILYPAREGSVTLEGTIDARRADDFDYVIEWAPGVEPTDDQFTTIAMGMGETERIEGELTSWDIATLDIDNGDEEGIHNRYTVTVRIRVTAHYGGDIGDVRGEQRRAFAIAPDDTLLPAFPMPLGLERGASDIFQAASGEGSPKLADLDGDGDMEIILGDADGLLHVIQADGTELAGFPVRLGTLRGHDPADPLSVVNSAAYASGAVNNDELSSSILATPAIGDLDNDGSIEIVAVTMEGDIYAYGTDGALRDGFPIGLPDVPSSDPRRGGPANEDSILERGVFATPALSDLDSDDSLEIVIAGFDGQVHVFREDGSIQPGFPVLVVAGELWVDPDGAQPSRIMTSPAIGDADNDGIPDIAVGSNEYGDSSATGAIHLIHGDGNNHEGGASHTGWPIDVVSIDLFPLVGRGTTTPVAMADVDGDGIVELALSGNASRMLVFEGVQPARARGEDPEVLVEMNSAGRGPLNTVPDTFDTPLLNTFAQGSFHDFDQDGVPDFSTGGAGLRLAANLAGGFENRPFTHQIGAWSSGVGTNPNLWQMLPGFPQKIEDYLFFNSPSSADVDGDGYPELLIGSGGYWVHAWDACGNEAEGFPKFVGGWVIASVAAGDVDGDDLLEVVVTTRSGYLYVFDTTGPADGSVGWPEYRHDNRNTGNYETPLAYGSPVTADAPIECEIPVGPDAGVGDAAMDGVSAEDAGPGSDAGSGPGVSGGGCDCRVSSAPTDSSTRVPLLLGLLGLMWMRRRARH